MKNRSNTTRSSGRKTSPKQTVTKITSARRRACPVTKAAEESAPRAPHWKAPSDYAAVLADVERLITDSRRRALATVNRELVCLYWSIGRAIVRQQETAQWGDAVVERLANDLRLAFPDMKGLSRDNVFRMRQFFLSCRDLNRWLDATFADEEKVGAARRLSPRAVASEKVGAMRRQLPAEQVATAPPQMATGVLPRTPTDFRPELSA
jgi:hypothetical protein